MGEKAGSHSNGHHLFAALRTLIPTHSKDIAKHLTQLLGDILQIWLQKDNMTNLCSYMLDEHLDHKREQSEMKKLTLNMTRTIEGLITLSGNILRNSTDMLNALSMEQS